MNPVITCSVQTLLIQIAGQNMEKQGRYWLQVYDGNNNNVGTIGINADSNGSFITSYRINGTEAPGNWRVDAMKGLNFQYTEASCTFFVRDLPYRNFRRLLPELSWWEYAPLFTTG